MSAIMPSSVILKVIRQFFVTVSHQVPARSPVSRCAPQFGGVQSSSTLSIATS